MITRCFCSRVVKEPFSSGENVLRRASFLAYIFALVSAVPLLVQVGWCQSEKVRDSHNATRTAYPKVALACTEPLTRTSVEIVRSGGPAAFIARSKAVLLDMEGITDVDPELKSIAEDISKAVRSLLESYQDLIQASPPPGLLNQTLNFLYYGATLQFEAGEEYDKNIKNQSTAVKDAVAKFIRAYNEVDASALVLTRVAKRISGPARAGQGLFTVDIDEPWGFQAPLQIRLHNNSGTALHNCTVVATLVSKTGEVRHNVHYTEEWPANCTMHGFYEPGIKMLDRQFARQTVSGLQQARVDLYCDELTKENISYQYVGAERDKDIARYLDKKLKVATRYRPFAKGVLWDDQRAIILSFQGLQELPWGKFTVTCTSAGRAVSRTHVFQQWLANKEQAIEFREITWDPAEWTARCEFEGTVATRCYRWKR